MSKDKDHPFQVLAVTGGVTISTITEFEVLLCDGGASGGMRFGQKMWE